MALGRVSVAFFAIFVLVSLLYWLPIPLDLDMKDLSASRTTLGEHLSLGTSTASILALFICWLEPASHLRNLHRGSH